LETQAIEKHKRKSLGKKLRFEVFKRDGFKCVYCGATPPSVLLHVDHITPASKGGLNEIDNLVTSCEPCNLGKSDRTLSDCPKSLQQKAAEVLEKEAQIAGYQSIMNAKRIRLEDDALVVEDVFTTFTGLVLTDRSVVSVRMFVDKLGLDVVRDAMEYACTTTRVRRGKEFKYFCGICWNRIRELEAA